MAGEAKTNAFMLGTATVMLGAQNDVWDLNPDEHSIGLVKNFRITGEPGFTDLTQGVKNKIVYSVMTQNTIRASMEAYEYTSKNLAYAIGLEGSGFAAQTAETTLTATAAVDDTNITVGDETGFAVDDWIMIQDGTEDKVYVRKVSATAAGSLTFTQGLGAALPIGATVRKANMVGIGSTEDQPFLAAKIVGTLADGTEIAVICPKIRITNGFSLGFTTENFDNLPLEFSFYDLTAADTHYSDFPNVQARLFTTK